MRGLCGTANWLHVRTRTVTVRSALVVAPGDRWSAERRAESERHLRAYDFLLPDSVWAVPVEGSPDSVDVRVLTHDNWTTSPVIAFENAEGRNYGSFSLTERNLLGLGLTVSATYREDPVGISRFISAEQPAIAGSHWAASFIAGNGDAGKVNAVGLALPFWADDAPRTAGGAWKHEISLAHLFQNGEIVARVPVDREDWRVWWGTGHRLPDGTVQRFVATYRAIDHHLGESEMEPGAPGEFAGGEENLRLRRVEGEVTLWRPRFLVRQGIDFMDRNEDFDVGPKFVFGTGLAPRAFGSDTDEGWLEARAGFGADAGATGFGFTSGGVTSRVRSGLRELLGEGRARWVVQPGRRQAVVLGVLGAAGYRMPRDFQLRLGALNGLRGFPVDHVAGTQVWRGNAEWRFTAIRGLANLLTIGGAAFWDTGRAWGPGSDGERWHHDAGFGLRLSLPHSALNAVARFDVAWPIAPAVDGRHGPAYSIGSGQAF